MEQQQQPKFLYLSRKEKNLYSLLFFTLRRIHRKKMKSVFHQIIKHSIKFKSMEVKVQNEGISSIMSEESKEQQYKVRCTLTKFFVRATTQSVQDAFNFWKAQADKARNKHLEEKEFVMKFEQEMSYLHAVGAEIEMQIKKIDENIEEEVEEQAETVRWLMTKERREVNKFQESARNLMLREILQNHKRHNTFPQFYRLFLNLTMERLKDLYKQEIKAVKSNMIFQNKRKHDVIKAVMKKDPRKITKPKKMNQLMSGFTQVDGYNYRPDLIIREKQVMKQPKGTRKQRMTAEQEKKKSIIRYAQILRAVIWVQRRFRQRLLERKMGQYKRGDGRYNVPLNVKYM